MPSNKKRTGKKTKGVKKYRHVNKRSRRNKNGGNPYLAYTGRGGSTSGDILTKPALTTNTNGIDKTNPSTGPSSQPNGTSFSLSSSNLRGGGCGCNSPIQPPVQMGGRHHRKGCKCSICKQTGGSYGKYPDGLVGSNWGASPSSWPGVDGISGDRNYLALNTYNNDVTRQMTNTSPPGLPLLKGGKKTLKNRKQKGGVLSNFLTQDLINLGRQFQYDVGSAYNGIRGYQAPVNPMPWKDQLSTTPGNMNALKYL
jgi:hypothetical protein